MAPLAELNVVWLTGASCDGCSISVLGDNSVAPLEDLLSGRVEGLPRIKLIHPLLSLESGADFRSHLERAVAGELNPFVFVMESSVPQRPPAGSFAWLGEEEDGKLAGFDEWTRRLARNAEAVIAIGDCAVFGGPHSEGLSNPTGATGVESVLGFPFRSRAGFPVIHLPGCSVPPVFIATLVSVIHVLQGSGPALDLDPLGRPVFAYSVE